MLFISHDIEEKKRVTTFFKVTTPSFIELLHSIFYLLFNN